MRWRIFLLTLMGLCVAACNSVRALPAAEVTGGATYYVSQSGGSDGNTGTSPVAAWQTVAKVNSVTFAPGDTVLFERDNSWNEELDIDESGTAVQPITFSSYGSGSDPIIRRLTIDGEYTVFENITIDHQKLSGDAVRVRAQNCTLRNMTVRNGASDGVDASDADGLLIDSVLVHHFLAGSFTNQQDAHGIVATDIQGLTIRNTEIHHVSGDSFQADPSRSANVPMDILIEDAHFWTGPLAADFNDWHAGEVPGENAIDTKVADDDDWPTADRATFTIRNMVAHGWINDGFISNRAVFNMKEKIEAHFDGVTVYDAEIGFRIRGTRGNANVTVQNVIFYNLEKAIRAEDDLQNLIVTHNTFGGGIATLVQTAGGAGGVGSWIWLNNAFLDSVPPSQATDGSNKTAATTDFIDANGHDYHLAAGSTLQDAGVIVATVATDRDGNGRPQGDGYDVGAYEFVPVLQLAGSPSDQTISLNWEVNATVPATATWQIAYDGPAGDDPSPIIGLTEPTRSYSLTGLTNYTVYDVTVNAMVSGTPILTDILSVMPTDLLLYLPLVQK